MTKKEKERLLNAWSRLNTCIGSVNGLREMVDRGHSVRLESWAKDMEERLEQVYADLNAMVTETDRKARAWDNIQRQSVYTAETEDVGTHNLQRRSDVLVDPDDLRELGL